MNINNLDLNLLYVFEAIYSTNNISRAARLLDLSQPAMSNALARLRNQIDDPLFVRSGNGVVPTAHAKAMIEPVREALKLINRAIEPEVAFGPQSSNREFQLLIVEPLEYAVLPKLIELAGYNSNIKIEIQAPQIINLEKGLISGKLDLGIFMMPDRYPELISEPLIPLDLVAVARKNHPRIRNKLTFQQLQAERFVGLSLGHEKHANSGKVMLLKAMHSLVYCTVYKTSSMAHVAAETDLLALLPRVYASKFAETLELNILETDFPVNNQHFHMTWHKRNDADEGHQWLRENVKKIIENAYAKSIL